jgi:hypothetical protein
VITGALAPTGYFGAAGCTDQGCNDDTYTQQMAAAGAGNYADCIGVHYNEGIVSPKQSSGDPRDNYPTRYFGPCPRHQRSGGKKGASPSWLPVTQKAGALHRRSPGVVITVWRNGSVVSRRRYRPSSVMYA